MEKWTVGVTATCERLRAFDSHDDAAAYIETLPDHESGIYYLDGPIDGDEIKQRLESLRGELRAERISYGELAELQSLAVFIEPGDVELLEPAGVPEFPDDDND